MHLLCAKTEVEPPARRTRIEVAYELLDFAYRTQWWVSELKPCNSNEKQLLKKHPIFSGHWVKFSKKDRTLVKESVCWLRSWHSAWHEIITRSDRYLIQCWPLISTNSFCKPNMTTSKILLFWCNRVNAALGRISSWSRYSSCSVYLYM